MADVSKNGFTPSKIQDRQLFHFHWKFASEFLNMWLCDLSETDFQKKKFNFKHGTAKLKKKKVPLFLN